MNPGDNYQKDPVNRRQKQLDAVDSPKRRNVANILAWILIGVLFAATGVWMVWASRQPKIHSFFTPDE